MRNGFPQSKSPSQARPHLLWRLCLFIDLHDLREKTGMCFFSGLSHLFRLPGSDVLGLLAEGDPIYCSNKLVPHCNTQICLLGFVGKSRAALPS